MPEPAAEPPPDPSMEDILASIRRILDEEPAAATPPADPVDELLLDDSMRAPDPAPAPAPFSAAPLIPIAADDIPRLPTEPPAALLEPATADQATDAIRPLARLALERGTQITAAGPTLENLVREELRPLLKTWLDAHLPPLIERVVRGEIERLVHRAER